MLLQRTTCDRRVTPKRLTADLPLQELQKKGTVPFYKGLSCWSELGPARGLHYEADSDEVAK